MTQKVKTYFFFSLWINTEVCVLQNPGTQSGYNANILKHKETEWHSPHFQ